MPNAKGMADISGKKITVRTARASGRITLGKEAFELLMTGQCPKGDVLETAKIAAINAAKQTPTIIPMCHTIVLDTVKVALSIETDDKTVTVNVQVKSSAKTGVEMEALTGVSAACLTIYDMLKSRGKDMIISDIKLLRKTGGKSGNYKRND